MNSDIKALQSFIGTHFETMESLLRMGLVQNIIKALDDGIAPYPIESREKFALQVYGCEWDISDCRARIITDYVAAGYAEATIADLSAYIKPEDNKIYYVINQKYHGSIPLSIPGIHDDTSQKNIPGPSIHRKVCPK